MKDLKTFLNQWDKLINDYERDAKQIQRKMTNLLKSEWGGNARTISVVQMKQFISRSGMVQFLSKLFLKVTLEKFSSKAESKLLRAIFAFDAILCNIENEVDELEASQRPQKKLKTEVRV